MVLILASPIVNVAAVVLSIWNAKMMVTIPWRAYVSMNLFTLKLVSCVNPDKYIENEEESHSRYESVLECFFIEDRLASNHALMQDNLY